MIATQFQMQDFRLREALTTICQDVKKVGGRALLVGGAVRDALLARIFHRPY